MRTATVRLWMAALALMTAGSATHHARADDTTKAQDLNGTWKFVIVQPVDTDLLLINIKDVDGKPTAEIKDSPFPAQQRPRISSVERKDGKLNLVMTFLGNDAKFVGATEEKGKVYGTFQINGQTIPARLDKTEETKVDPQASQAKMQEMTLVLRDRNAKSRVEKIKDFLKEAADPRAGQTLYNVLVGSATEAELTAEDVRKYLDEWRAGAKAYGPEWEAQVSTTALKLLTGKKPYADVAFELASASDKALGEGASLESRAEIAKALATAAKLAGKDDVAKAAAAKSEKLEGELDAEYHHRVPPFKPETSVARKEKKADRVVLMELFTGAQCPPCVAADVGFDALLTSYKPTEVIGLQYHLHVPGPDPLTNKDSVARSRYYGDEISGTPSTFFNGRSEAGGGGGMANSRGKYDEFREIIDRMLEGHKQADIVLKADRAGDEIKIVATAKALASDEKAKKKGCDDEKDEPKKEGKLKLRLVLIEEQVRYVGGNRLRFHHHVVRAFPGGVDGKELTDGQGKAETTVNLKELRDDIEKYLSDFAKNGRDFPNPLPEIKFENLSVVAFVQDDDNHNILHAVQAAIPK